MSRIILWGAVLTFLFFSTPELTAGIVSDVQIAGGYLYEVSTDRTVIYDLTVTPPEQVSVITYPESISYPDQDQYFAINAVVEKNRLFIYFYHEEADNGIRIYELTNLAAPELQNILSISGTIRGGMLANRLLLPSPDWPYGKFSAINDFLFFSGDTSLEYDSTATPYRYSIKENVMKRLFVSWDSSIEYCNAPASEPMGNPLFYFFDNDRLIIYSSGQFFTSPIRNFMFDDRVCLLRYPITGATAYYHGHLAGPMEKIENYIVTRWYGVDRAYSSFTGSGLAIWDFDQKDNRVLVEVSDFYCTYLDTHGEGNDDLADDIANSSTDVQDILVHNGEIYLSSYYTRSIAHTYYYKDWGDSMSCQDYWNFYDIPQSGRPYGIAAANGKLYVAGKDQRYDFPLAKPDTELPVGGVYSAKAVGTTFTVSGWAEDSEGIKQVTVRLDHAYQFLADRIESCSNEPPCEGHCRPVVDPCKVWSVRVPLADIQPGTYEMKVIAEDMDGDFSVIHEQSVQIPSLLKTK